MGTNYETPNESTPDRKEELVCTIEITNGLRQVNVGGSEHLKDITWLCQTSRGGCIQIREQLLTRADSQQIEEDPSSKHYLIFTGQCKCACPITPTTPRKDN